MIKTIPSLKRILALARLILLDGVRSYALLSLILFALAGICGGLLFFGFIPQDIGRATNDFLFSVIWITGFIFLLFHTVHVMAWNNNRGALHTYLARPLSRTEYGLAVFSGLAALLFLLNIALGSLGWLLLLYIKQSVDQGYFPLLSFTAFVLAGFGIYLIELKIMAVIFLISSAVRGSFPVLLLALCYYFICSGLPVVRESLRQQPTEEPNNLDMLLKGLTAIFPDFSRLDFKTIVVTNDLAPSVSELILPFALSSIYITIVLWLACVVYTQRDLQ